MRKAIVTLAVAAALLPVLGASTASTASAYEITAHDVAELTISMYPRTCHQIRYAIRIMGYHRAERFFERAYGHDSPPAAAVFYVATRLCRR